MKSNCFNKGIGISAMDLPLLTWPALTMNPGLTGEQKLSGADELRSLWIRQMAEFLR